MSTNPLLFDEPFVVQDINPGGRKYEKVSRLVCQSKTSDTAVTVDVNSELFPVAEGERLVIGLASTINLHGEQERNTYDHTVYHRETAMSAYDYVMHGKAYECNAEDRAVEKVVVLLSFGGLLMKVEGTATYLRDVKFNANYYVLMKKSQ